MTKRLAPTVKKEASTKKTLTLPDWMWDAIAHYRYAQRIVQPEQVAIRLLLKTALDKELGK